MADAQKIVPNLWCDHNADELTNFYVSVFPDSSILSKSQYPDSQENGLADFQLDFAGKTLTVEFELGGYRFTAINAGSEFKPNPAISFMVNFDPSKDSQAREHLDEIWNKLSEGGTPLMELGEYPFSKHYGWITDKFGYSWQLILTNPDGEDRPYILPNLMFTKDGSNHAEEAIKYYTEIFSDAKIGSLSRYGDGQVPNGVNPESLMFADFRLAGQWFAAMDSGTDHDFTFNEAISLAVFCKDQAEIDRLWGKLSADPQFEQCGWCKDKFGVAWQIVPENVEELLRRPDGYVHMMQMKKLVIDEF